MDPLIGGFNLKHKETADKVEDKEGVSAGKRKIDRISFKILGTDKRYYIAKASNNFGNRLLGRVVQLNIVDHGKTETVTVNKESLRLRLGIDKEAFNQALKEHSIDRLVESRLRQLVEKNNPELTPETVPAEIQKALTAKDFDRAQTCVARFIGSSTNYLQRNALTEVLQGFKESDNAHVREKADVFLEDLESNTVKTFSALKDYIKSKYPDFNISRYEKIEDLQQAGHPIHFALMKNDEELLKLLIAAGADVNQVDKDGNTPLFICQNQGSPNDAGDYVDYSQFLLLLLNHGADCTMKNNEGQSVLEILFLDKFIDTAAEFHRDRNKIFEPLISNKDLSDLLRKTIQEKSKNIKTNKERDEFLGILANILHYTRNKDDIKVLTDAMKMIKSLAIESTQPKDVVLAPKKTSMDMASVDMPDKDGRTRLYQAVETGNDALIDALLESGANPNKEIQFSSFTYNREHASVNTPLKLAQEKLRQVESRIDNLKKLGLEINPEKMTSIRTLEQINKEIAEINKERAEINKKKEAGAEDLPDLPPVAVEYSTPGAKKTHENIVSGVMFDPTLDERRKMIYKSLNENEGLMSGLQKDLEKAKELVEKLRGKKKT